MKKMLVIWVNGLEETETIFPVDLMRRAGIKVDTVSITDKLEILSSHNIFLKADKLFEDINIDDYDGIMFPGGAGYKEYEKNLFLKETVEKYILENKLVTAICAAPSYLAKIGVLKNKEATVYKGFDHFLTENGAIYVDVPVIKANNIITARSVAAAKDFGLEVVEYILGKETRINLEEEIINY